MDINSQKEGQDSQNEESGQAEKKENSPVTGDESLEVDFLNAEHNSTNLEQGQEEKTENSEENAKKARLYKTIAIIILLLLPPAYIFYKTTNNPKPPQEQPASQQQQIDISSYESAANANPTFANLLNLSNAYINNRMAGKSIEPLKKAIALNPKSAAAYSNLGLAYTIMSQYRNGIEACEKAVQIDSTFQLAKNNLKWAKDEQNKILNEIHKMEQVPESKRDVTFYNTYGLYYLKFEDYDKSIEIFNKMLVLDPKNSAAFNNLGTAFMSKHQYDDAIKYFKKAIEANANDQLAKNNLAWALDEKKKVEEPLKK